MEGSALIGRYALSISGKDCGRILLILALGEDGSLFVADGRKRKVENPKRKKSKHLSLLPESFRFEGIPTNRRVWRGVKAVETSLFA